MADSEVRLWIPGSDSRRVARGLLVAALIILVVLSSFSQLLPGMFGPVTGGSGDEERVAQPSVTSVEEGPKVPLPPGAIHYGTRIGTSLGRVLDSAIPSHLTTTVEAFEYQTSYGHYLFNRNSPFVFSLRSRTGVPLTAGSAFLVASTSSVLTTGVANVTAATDQRFEVRYEIVSGEVIVGFLLLQVEFYRDTKPKFTAVFSKAPAWNSGTFNVVWSTATVDRWLKHPDAESVLDMESLGRGLPVPRISRVEVGPSEDLASWREWVTTDWSDSPGGLLEVGDRGLANLLTSSTSRVLTVVFPTNVAVIDPTQVATTTIDFATAYSSQRKTFDHGGYYFVFWYDGSNIVYSTSLNGQTWSSVFSAGSGLVGWGNFDVYQSGSSVALAWMKYDPASYGDKTINLMFRRGTLIGNSITWDPIRTLSTLPQPYTSTPSVAMGTDGNFWAAGIWYNTTNTFYYHIWIYRSTDGGVTFTESTRYLTSSYSSRMEALQLIPLAQGKLMALSSHYYDTTIRWKIWNPVSPSGPYWASIQSLNLNLLANTAKTDRVSATSTPDGFVQLISQQYVGGSYYLAWTRYNSTSDQWTNDPSISGGSTPQIYPSISADSLGNLHVFWTLLSGTTTFGPYYTYRPKGGLNWAASSQPFGSITNAKWLSAARTASKEVLLAWTLGTSSPYQIFFGSLPLPSGVASGPPARPWSRVGLSPYEQYFSQNEEHLSPGNGLLTVSQTDLSVPGRNGLTLSIARLYVQPFTFSQGNPFNYAASPYANVGSGWRLNFPWVTQDTSQVAAQYLHYPNGQLFPIAWTSTATNTAGTHVIKTFTMENHATEDFVFSRTDETDTSTQTTTTYKLTTKDGAVFNFNGLGVLTSVVDRTGQNQVSFSYVTGTKLSTITDTVGRQAIFNYDASNRLSNVTYGGRLVRYTYSGSSLWTVTDPAGRTTNLRYSPVNSWLLSGVIYSSGGNSTYAYGSVTVGTDAVNYYVTLRNVFSGPLVRTTSFSYNITDGEVTYTSVKQSDGLAVQGYTDYEFNARAESMTRTIFNATRAQMIKNRFWYDANGRAVQEDVYSGNTATRSFYNSRSYDQWGNIVYTRDNIGHESYQSFANTDTQYTFGGPGMLSTSTDGLRLHDDFNGPNLNGATWAQGGSANGRVISVADSQLTLKGSSSTQGTWKSNWIRSSGTYNYPLYSEVQMSMGANPGSNTTNADFMISPQATASNGDPFLNSDGLRLVLADGPYYRVVKRVGGVATILYDSGLVQAGSLTISWKVELTDRNTIRVYLNKGAGYSLVYSTTSLGLSTSFAPAYAYLSLYNLNIATHSANFDHASLYSSNQVVLNGLQSGQKVELYDWQNVLRSSGTVAASQSSITLNATSMVFPYGYVRLYELDGRTIQFTSPMRDIWGGSTYSYTQPFKSGGLTRTSTGFLKSTNLYIEDSLPSPANSYSDGGDAWVWATQSYAPVVSGSQSHVGFTATGTHQHYFQEAYPGLAATPGSFHVQYVYVPSSSVPSEIMLQFHDNAVSNPGFETGNFNVWTQTGMIIRADYIHSGLYSGAPSYNPSTQIYSAFTLQQNFPTSIAGNRITAIQFWYRDGDPYGSDVAQVLYTDATYTQTTLTNTGGVWTQRTLSFDNTKQISGIKVVRSAGSYWNIILDDFVVFAGAWEHRAYWGSNLISWGTDGTASRRPMGTLPSARDSWIMLIVKTDDVATNGLNIDGLAYTLYDGGVYWDYSALGASSTGTITINSLLGGQKVELYDSNMVLKVSGTVSAGQSSVTLDVYSAGINAFPYRGYLKVYTTTNNLQYSSPLMTDIWGGDVYSYNQPVFSNRYDPGSVGNSIHNALIGTAQYQDGSSVKQETYAKYDSVGNMLRDSKLHNGSLLNSTYTYDTYGNRLSEVNANGQQDFYSYSATHQSAYLTSTTRVLNTNTNVTNSYVYDFTNGNQIAVIDPMGYRTDYQFDSVGRITILQHPEIGGVRSEVDMYYNDSQNNLDIRNEKGNYTRPEYDGLGRITTVEKYSGVPGTPVLSEERIDYEWQDGVKSYNASGPVTTYSYDYLGRLVKVTNSDGTYRTSSYDDLNLIQSNYDENQHRTDYLYDPLQRLIGVREYHSTTSHYATSYFYDAVGNLVKTVAANPQVLTFTPTDDAYIRSDQPNSNFGSATTLQVDNSPVKNFLLKFTVTGVGSAQVTSAKLRLYAVDPSPNGGSFYKTTTSTWTQSTVTWNNAPPTQGSVIASLGSVSANTWYMVDLTSVVTGDGVLSLRVTSPNSDGADYTSKEGTSWFIPQLIVTISTGQTTTYSYDDLNRLTLTKYPDGFNETRTYDNVGNLVSKKDPSGNTITYTYDYLNRLTNITYPDSTKANFAYDKNGNRISMSNPNSTATFTYDARNRLTSEAWVIDGTTHTLNYTYDAVGNLASITYPDGVNVSYSMDPLNRATTVKKGSSTLANVTYTASGFVKTVSYSNGVTTTYTYDSRDRVSRIKTIRGGSTLLDLNYTLDNVGNVLSINTESYTYDFLDRLTYSSGPWATLQYGYDAIGNRIWMKEGAANSTYIHGAYNRLLSASSTSYSYDNNGNLRSKTSGSTTTVYNYDFENRLTKVTQGGSTLGAYAYDPFGQRVKKVESGTTTVYLNQGVNVLYEKQGLAVNDYVLVGQSLLARLSGANTFYFHQDFLGSTRLVTLGATTDYSSNYQPFGPQYGATGTDPVYKYTGQQHDTATGLYYYGARYYDTSVGRFLSRDPASPLSTDPQSLSPYSYVRNNPETSTDPTGRATFSGSAYWRARWVIKTALYALMISFLYAIWPVVSNPGLASIILAATVPVIAALGNFIALATALVTIPFALRVWARSWGWWSWVPNTAAWILENILVILLGWAFWHVKPVVYGAPAWKAGIIFVSVWLFVDFMVEYTFDALWIFRDY